jgi:hypothetical protein
MIYILSCIAGGFLAGWVARSQLEKRLRGGNLGRDPLVMNEGRTVMVERHALVVSTEVAEKLGRLYKGGLYRIKGSDIWYPIGTEPNWTELARDQVRQRTPNPPPREP